MKQHGVKSKKLCITTIHINSTIYNSKTNWKKWRAFILYHSWLYKKSCFLSDSSASGLNILFYSRDGKYKDKGCSNLVQYPLQEPSTQDNIDYDAVQYESMDDKGYNQGKSPIMEYETPISHGSGKFSNSKIVGGALDKQNRDETHNDGQKVLRPLFTFNRKNPSDNMNNPSKWNLYLLLWYIYCQEVSIHQMILNNSRAINNSVDKIWSRMEVTTIYFEILFLFCNICICLS